MPMFQGISKESPHPRIGLVLNYDFPFPKDPENPHDLDAVQVDAIKGVGWADAGPMPWDALGRF